MLLPRDRRLPQTCVSIKILSSLQCRKAGKSWTQLDFSGVGYIVPPVVPDAGTVSIKNKTTAGVRSAYGSYGVV